MIDPMIKYSFLVFHKDYDQFLNDVRELGLLHIIEKNEELNPGIRDKYDQIKQLQSALKFLKKRELENAEKGGTPEQGEQAYQKLSQAQRTMEGIQQEMASLKKEIAYAELWGDFSPETLQKLEAQGIKTRFFTIAARKFNHDWLRQYPIEIISNLFGQTYFVLFDRGEKMGEDFQADEMRPPERPLSVLYRHRDELLDKQKEIDALFDHYAKESIPAIEAYARQIIDTAEYEKVLVNTEHQAEEKVMLLEGWLPLRKQNEMDAYLDQNTVVFVKQRATKNDRVPIALKNNKFVSKFEAIGELYSLPKYGELDLTPYFAPFYMLFFGFCLGDAGYGLLMAIVALIAQRKVNKELRQAMGLVFYLGLATIMFGLLSGTVFGILLYETNMPVYSTIAQNLSEQGTDINKLFFNLSLALGAIQILFGMTLRVTNEIRQYGWKAAISTLGWLILLPGSGILYALGTYADVAASTLKPFWIALFIITGSMILLLNDINRNVFVNIGVGLWNTYNMLTGLLGDLLSYIRLFALSISSAILGFVFNRLAVELSGNIPVLSIIIMVIILVFGHGINLFMSGLGSFVHPLRLTFVEFYKNAGFTGGGKKYEPFRKLS